MKLAPPRPTPRRPGPTGPAPSLQLALEPRLLLSADLVALALSAVPDAADGTPDDALEVLMAAGDSSVAETQPAPATPTGAPGDRRSARAASQSGSVLVFAGQGVDANGEPVGRELLYTDGATTGLLKDIYPGARSSSPTDFFQLQDGRVLFVANDGVHGRELWVTDGSTAGTQQVGDINTGTDLGAVHIGIVGGQAGDVLSYTPAVSGGRIQSRWDSVGQVLTLFGGGSVDEYLSALGEVTFSRGGAVGHGLSTGDTVQIVVAAGPDLPVHFDTQQPRFLDIVGKLRISATRARDEVFWSERYGLAARLSPVLTEHELGLAKTLMTGRGVDKAWIGLERVGNDWVLDWDGDRQGEYTANTVLSGMAKGGDLSDEAGPYGVLEEVSSNNYEIYGDTENAITPYGYLVEYTPRVGEAYGALFEFSYNGSAFTVTRQVLTMGAAPGAQSPSANAVLSSGKLPVFSGGAGDLLLHPEGRRPARDIGDSLATDFIEFTDSDDKQWVLLAANDGVHGVELWRLDPSNNSLTLLKDINTDKSKSWNPLGNAHPEGFVVFDDKVLFTALDGTHGRELWVSDGTEAGTQLVKDLRTGTRTLSGNTLPQDGEPTGLTVLRTANGLRAVFAADSGAGRQLWITDGKASGTQLLKTLRSGSNAEPAEFVVVPGTTTDTVFFVAYDGTHGRELWVSDGTGGGTQVLDVMLSGNGSSRPAALTVYGEYVFFTATASGSVGRELWVSDGTAGGTVRVTNIDTRTGAATRRVNQGPRELFVWGDKLFFSAEDNNRGYEPYALDVSPLDSDTGVAAFASAASPVRLADVRGGSNKGSFPRLFSEFGGKVYFSADDGGTHGRELWVTDGTAAGTQRAADVNPGRAGSSPTGLQVATQKTVAGTTLTASDDEAAIVAVQDGLEQAQVLLAQLRVMASPQTGVELFRVGQDGTVSLLKDIRLGRDGSYPRVLVPLASGQVLFVADDGWRGRELWITDGSAAGTQLWKDVHPGGPASDPHLLQVLDGEVHFVADDGAHGFELWRIDKTTGKAVRLTDMAQGAAHTALQALAWHQGKVVFQVDGQWYELDQQGAPKALDPNPMIDPGDNTPFALASYTASADMTQYVRTLQVVSSISAGKVYDLSRARIVIEAAAADTFSRWSLRALARSLSEDLQDRFGVVVPVLYTGLTRPGDIVLVVDGDALVGTNTSGRGAGERYRLQVDEKLTISGDSPRAVFYGTRTLLKLLGLAGGVQADGQLSLPAVDIKDWPGVGWRSMMLDVGRKYMQPDFIEQQLRQASWLGMNMLRLHISEWNAFRLHSQQFPGLDSTSLKKNGSFDPRFYSRAELARLHDIARRYFVDLFYEVDMPSHSKVLNEYDPHLRLGYGNTIKLTRRSLDFTTVYGRRWIANLLGEFVPHFDSTYYHIGADEIDTNNRLGEYAHAIGLSGGGQAALLDFVNTTAARLASEYGKRTMMWVGIENQSGGLYEDIIIETWYSNASKIRAEFRGRNDYVHSGGDNDIELYYTPGTARHPHLMNPVDMYATPLPDFGSGVILGYEMAVWGDNAEVASDAWFQNGVVGVLGAAAPESIKPLDKYNVESNANARGLAGIRNGMKTFVPTVAARFWTGSVSALRVQDGFDRYRAVLDAFGPAPGVFSLETSLDTNLRLLGGVDKFYYVAGAETLIDVSQTLTYVGGNRARLAGVRITVEFSTALADDRLGVATGSGFEIDRGQVRYFGRTVGTVVSANNGVGKALEIELNYRADHKVMDALLRSLTYAYVPADGLPLPGNLFGRQLTVAVEGRGRKHAPRSEVGDFAAAVSRTHTQTLREAVSVSMTAYQDRPNTLTDVNFGEERIRVIDLPANGRLLSDGQAVPVNVWVSVDKLQYVPRDGYSGKDSFGFMVWDGTTLSTVRLLDITVEANSRATGLTLTGDAEQRQTLTAVTDRITDTDGAPDDGFMFTYQWQRGTTDNQGVTTWAAIDDATAAAYILVQDDVGAEVRVVVRFEDAVGAEEVLVSDATTAVMDVNDPVAGTVALTGLLAGELQPDLSGITDADGLPSNGAAYTYQWQRSSDGSNWVDIDGAVAATYPLGPGDVSYQLRVVVSFTDAASNAEELTSTATVAMQAWPSIVVENGKPVQQGAELRAGIGTLGSAGETVTLTVWQWQRRLPSQQDWTDIQGADGERYTLMQADVGHQVRVVVSGSSAGKNTVATPFAEQASLSTVVVANVNDVATGTVAIAGAAVWGTALELDTSGIQDTDGLPQSYTYQWQRSTDGGSNWANISGETASTYTLGQDDVGAKVRVVVHFTDALGGQETLDSAATDVVQPLQLVETTRSIRSPVAGIAVAPGVVLRPYDAAGVAVATYPALHVILTDGQSGDTLSVDSQVLTANGVAHAWDDARKVLTLTGGTSVAAYQSVLRAVKLEGLDVGDTRQVVIVVGPDPNLKPFWFDDRGEIRIRYYEVLLKSSAAETVTTVWSKVDDMPPKFGMRPYLATVASKAEQLFIKELVNAVPDDQKLISGLSLMSIEGQDVPPVRVWFGLYKDHDGYWNYRGGPEKGMTPSDLGFNRHHPSWNAASNKPTAMMEIRNLTSFTDGVRWEQGDAENTWVFGYVVEYGHESVEVAALQTSIAVTRGANQPATGLALTGTAEQGQALTAVTSGITDADGMPAGDFVFTYQWERSTDGGDTWAAIDSATGMTYTLGPADAGHTLRVVVSFTDAAGNNEALTSTATGTVTNVNDPVTGTVALTGLLAGELQPDVSGIDDADGLPAVSAYTYQWQRSADGNTWVNIVGATAATYPLGPVDVGSQLQVVVGFTDLQGTDETLTSTPTAAVVARPSIVVDGGGGVQQGATLRAGTGTLGGVGETVALAAWQWQRSADAGNNWTAISNADSATYTLGQADVGYLVRVKVSGTSTPTGGGVATAITDSASLATAAVANVNDAATGLTLTGDAAWGHELTADTSGITDADGAPRSGFVYTYQWQRSTDSGNTWAAISGAIASTYTLVQDDVGTQVRVVVGFTDALGGEETLGSDPTAEVQPLQLVQADSAVRSSAVGIAVAPGVVLRAFDAAGVAVATYPALHLILTDGQSGDTLSVDSQVLTDNGVAGNWDATRRVLTLTGGADVAAYQAVLREVVLAGLTVDDTRQVVIAVGPDASLAPFWYTDSTNALRIRYYEVFRELGAETPTAMVTRAGNLPAKFGMRPYLATVASAAESDFIARLIRDASPSSSHPAMLFGLHKNGNAWVYDGGPEMGQSDADMSLSGKRNSGWASKAVAGIRGVLEVLSSANSGDASSYEWYPATGNDSWPIGFVVEYGHEAVEVALLQVRIEVEKVNQAATGTADFRGTPMQKETLTASVNDVIDADGLPDPLVYSYAWQRSTDAGNTWTAIVGATGNTYALVQADVGYLVRVVVGFTDAAGNPESLTSEPTVEVGNVNDPAGGSVSITGLLAGVLQADLSKVVDADGLPGEDVDYRYRWQRKAPDAQNWAAISGATNATYSLVPGDVGYTIQVVVSFTDAQGTAEGLTSTPTGVVEARPSIVVAGGGPVQQGAVLRAGSGTLGDVGATVVLTSYQWQRKLPAAQDWTAISNADSATYTLGQADVGYWVRVKVSGTSTVTDGAATAITDIDSLATGAVARVTLVFAGHGVDVNGQPVGRELLYTDGTTTGLLKDIYPGARSSSPTDFFQLQDGRVLFVANDGVHGRELWVTDGSTAGTQRVGDINTGSDLGAVHIGIVGGQTGDVLSYTPTQSGGRIQGSWDSVGQVLTLSGGGSVDEYLSALGEVTFSRGGVGHGLSNGDTVQIVVAAGPDLPVHFDTQQRPRFLDIVGKLRISATRARDEVFWSERYGLAARLSPVLTEHELGLAKTLMTGRGVDKAWIGLEQVGNDWVLDWDGDRQGEYTVNTVLSGMAKGGDLNDETGTYGVLEKVSSNNYQIYGDTENATTPYGYLVEYTPRVGEAYGALFEFSYNGNNGSAFTVTRQVLSMGTGVGDTSSAAAVTLKAGKLPVFSGGEDDIVLQSEGRRPFRGTGDSLAAEFVEFTDSDDKQWVLLAANDGVHGVELWRLNPADNSLTLLKDINTDKDKSWNPLGNAHPEGFVVFGKKVLFTALDGTHGRELWVTDGTTVGTQRVKDIRTGTRTLSGNTLPQDGEPTELTVLRTANGLRAVFAADSGAGRQLWITDGTEEGTQLLKTLRAGSNAEPAEFVVVPGTSTDKVFFVAYDATHGRELWVTDGTSGGTQVINVLSGSSSSRPASLTVYGEYVFFTATTSSSVGRELWVSDGTSGGTVRLTDIDTRTDSTSRRVNQGPRDLFVWGDMLLFSAENSTDGFEPYALDVSSLGNAPAAFDVSANLVQLGNFRTGAQRGSFPRLFSEFEGKVYFSADDGGTHGRELWVTDGTAAGTQRAADVNPGRAGSSPTGLQVATQKTVAGTTLTASDDEAAIVAVQDGLEQAQEVLAQLRVMASPQTGVELFRVGQDGTVALLKDIRLGRDGSYPRALVPLASGQVLFVADDGWRGRELWITDGSAAGTQLWKDVHPGGPSSDPHLLQVLDGEVHFVADDGAHGFELWQIDKTTGKAVRLTDIEQGAAHTALQALAWQQGKVVFQADGQWYELDQQGAPKALDPNLVIDPGDNTPFALASYTASADMTQYVRTLQVVSSISAGKVYDLSRARIVIEAAAADTFSRWSLRSLARTLSEDLQDSFGVVVPVLYTGLTRPGDIVLVVDGDALAGTNTSGRGAGERYRLQVDEKLTISGDSPRAVFYGTRTLLKLLGLAGGVQADGQLSLPAVDIKDWPRVSWRGMMLDTGRKYFQPDFLEQQLRQASWLGMNVLRMHVTEWNAFRLNSQQFPGLGGTVVTGYNASFYTRAELERLQDVARRHFVDLMFELDLPGHARSMAVYDPHLVGLGSRNRTVDITTPYGRRWVANMLDEFMPHFDSAYYHLGADEVKSSSPLSNYGVVHGLSSNVANAVLVWAHATAARLAVDYGKRSIMWDGADKHGSIGIDRDIIVQFFQPANQKSKWYMQNAYDMVYSNEVKFYYTPGLYYGVVEDQTLTGTVSGKQSGVGTVVVDESSMYSTTIPYAGSSDLLGYGMAVWPDEVEVSSDGWFQDGRTGVIGAKVISKALPGQRNGLKMAMPAVAAAFWDGSGDSNKQVQGGWSRYQALLDALGRAPGLFSLDISTDDEVHLVGADGEVFFYDAASSKSVLIDTAQTLAYVGGTRERLTGVVVSASFAEALTGDRLGVAPGSGFEIKNGQVQYFGRTVGAVLSSKDGVGRELGVRLNYRAGREVLDALLRSLTYVYVPADDSPLPANLFGRTLTLSVAGQPRGYDGALDSSVTVRQTRALRALPVVVTGQTHTFSADDFGSPQQLRIGSLPVKGELLLDGQAVAVNTVVPLADMGKLTYAASDGVTGDSFRFAVWDSTSASWSVLRELVIRVQAKAKATGTVTITGTVEQNAELKVSVAGVSDGDGLPQNVVYAYQWQRSTDGGDTWAAIDSATGTTYTLVQADVRHTLRVVVSFQDQAGNDEALTSAATEGVANVNDPATGSVAITGLLAGVLQADLSEIDDADGLPDPVVYSYQWQRKAPDAQNWADIVDATAAIHLLGPADVGSQLQVVVSFTDAQRTVEGLTSTPTGVVGARPSIVVDGGRPVQQGALLRAGEGTLGDVGATVVLASYQWQRSTDAGNNWTDISNADSATYTLVQDDVGYWVRVKVSGTSTPTGGGVATVITDSASLATGAVANVNDPATGLTVSGTAMVGHELAAVTSAITDLDGTPPGGFVYSYQWQRSTDSGSTWAAISGETASTYTLGQDDVGAQVRVVVHFTDALDGAETLGSAPTVAVQPLQLVQADSIVRSSAAGIAVAPGVVLRAFDAAGVAVATYPALHVILTDGKSGDTLTVDSQVLTANGMTQAWDATRRVLTLTGGADVAAYQAVLREVVLAGLTVDDTRQVVLAVGPDASLAPFWYTDSTNALRIRYYEVFRELGAETPTAMVTRAGNLPAKFGMRPYLATVASAAESDFIARLIRDASPSSSHPAMLFGLHKNGNAWVYDGGPEMGQSDADMSLSGKRNSGWASKAVAGIRGVLEVLSSANSGDASSYEWYPATGNDSWPIGFVVEYGHEAVEVALLQTSIAVTRAANQAATGLALTGTAQQKETLTAVTSGIADPDGLSDPVTYTYEWQREVTVTPQSGQPTTTWNTIDAETDATYTLAQADVGHQVRVVVGFTDGQGTAEALTSAASGPVANVNDAPTGLPGITGTVAQAQELAAVTDTIDDLDGAPAGGFVFTYQWERGVTDDNNTPQDKTDDSVTWDAITAATGRLYTLAQADVGHQVRVVVGFTDGQGTAEALTSAASGPVANVNDAPTGLPGITGTVAQAQELAAVTDTIDDLDGAPAGGFVFTYQWERGVTDDNNTPQDKTDDSVTWDAITAATGRLYTLAQADVGHQVRVVVGFTDGQGTAEALTSAASGPVANVNDAPTGLPGITGTVAQAQELAAVTDTIDDLDGAPAGGFVFTYQWERGVTDDNNTPQDKTDDSVTWDAITAATGRLYTLAQADVGHQVRVVVGFTDGQGTAEALTSAATGPVANVNDAPTGLPGITGTVAQGQELTADTSAIADADGLGAFGYQWQRGVTDDKGTADTADDSVSWTAIVGETAATYTLAQADVGHQVRVVVGFTDGQGTAEALTSAASGPVTNVNEAPTGAVVITGTVAQAQELAAVTDTIDDLDGAPAGGFVFTYQWERGVTDDNNTPQDKTDDSVTWDAITAATGRLYTLAQADVGHQVRVVVGFTDGQGTAEALTSAASGPVANVNDAPTGLPGITGTVAQAQELAAVTDTIDDLDGAPAGGFVFTYQWERGVTDDNNTPQDKTDDSVTWDAITAATGRLYTLAQADVGHQVRVVVGFTDGQGTAEALTSAATGTVANVNDAPTGLPGITGTVAQGQELTADTSAIADADGLGAFGYQWQRGVTDDKGTADTADDSVSWTAIVGETAATYTLAQADVGHQVRVVVGFTDGQGTAEALTSAASGPVTNVNEAPTGAVVITGTVAQAQELAAVTDTIDDLDGAPAGGFVFTYQWERGVTDDNNTPQDKTDDSVTWDAITAATGRLYTLAQADVGHQVRVVVGFTDGQGTAEALTSAASGPVANVNDAPTGLPGITGTVAQAQELAAVTDTIDDLDGAPAGGFVFTYQWERGVTDDNNTPQDKTDDSVTWDAITAATGRLYTLAQADVGHRVRVVVGFTDGQGTAEALTSAASGPVADVNDAPTGAVVITGTVAQAQELTADTSAIADADGLGAFGYQWQRGVTDDKGTADTATTA